MALQIDTRTAPAAPLALSKVRYCQMCDGRWDEQERRDAELPYGGPRIPAWMIAWWRDYAAVKGGIERMFAEEFKHYERLEDFHFFHSTLDNCDFNDLREGIPEYAPYCRLYAFCDRTGRLYFADTIASGEVVKGWASVKVRYRFKDLIEQAGSLDS
jgi:hypothetical protein